MADAWWGVGSLQPKQVTYTSIKYTIRKKGRCSDYEFQRLKSFLVCLEVVILIVFGTILMHKSSLFTNHYDLSWFLYRIDDHAFKYFVNTVCVILESFGQFFPLHCFHMSWKLGLVLNSPNTTSVHLALR